jgi:hypothetical protein
MDTERVGSTENEQDWIQKYRDTLNVTSGTESRIKAVSATFSKVAGILGFTIRSILKKRVSTPPNAAVSKQPTKAGLVQTPTMPDRRLHSVQNIVVKQNARKRRSLQRRSEEKAS